MSSAGTARKFNKFQLLIEMFWKTDVDNGEIPDLEEIEDKNVQNTVEDKKIIEILNKSTNGNLKKLAKEHDIVPMAKTPRVKSSKFKTQKAQVKESDERTQSDKQLSNDDKELEI